MAVDAIITIISIISIDEKGIVDSANPATEHVFGYAIDETVGQNVKMLMPSAYQEEHDGFLQSYVGGGPRKIIVQEPIGSVFSNMSPLGFFVACILRLQIG